MEIYQLSRYWYSDNFRFYYAYGNTPAQDFLQNCSGKKEPTILVLGCGDMRSCFYSLWKNFNVNSRPRFDGVHFVLNDTSAAVLARNILFLYLCLRMPEEESELKKWLSGMWAIWYCHELYPSHDRLLHESLNALCKYSEDWSRSDNPLHSIVKFTAPTTLYEICKVWKMWLEQDMNVPSVETMHSARQANYRSTSGLVLSDEGASAFVEGCTEIPYEKKIDSKISDAQKSEVVAYGKEGSAFAEKVFGMNLSGTHSFVNLTLFERADGRYNLHYFSLPFRGYYHTVTFSGERAQSLLPTKFLVEDKHFQSVPLLANSVQQFSLWLRSSRDVLVSNHNVSFTFNCSHALSLCFELEHSKSLFDLIYTSNLMDHLGPPNLVLSAIPLLRESGLLFTTTLYKEECFETLDQYITTSFGFNSKFFPVAFGVRCINHEGDNYASPVTTCPCPLTFNRSKYFYQENIMIWEKLEVDTVPLVFPPGRQLSSVLASAFLSSVRACVCSLISDSIPYKLMRSLCLETSVKVLQVFASYACNDNSPLFWKPLSDAIKREKDIKPYLLSMQTRLILCNIHMHLTLTKKDCPICLQVPVSGGAGLFSAKTCLQNNYATPAFIALVHKKHSDLAEDLGNSARNGEDVHLFDCISSNTPQDYLQLFFYAPLSLVQEGYKVTIAISTMTLFGNVLYNLKDLPTQPLGSVNVPFRAFKSLRALGPNFEVCDLPCFGVVKLHTSTGDSSELEIDLLPGASAALATKKLHSKRVSSSVVQLSLGKLECHLKYPYPIAYDHVKITLHKREKKIIMHCPRAFQEFCNEQPLSIASPDKAIPLTLSESAMASFCGRQFTSTDREALETLGHQSALLPSLVRVKQSFVHLFQKNNHHYHLVDSDKSEVVGLVLVNSRLFNYEHRTPVVDLAFCFLEESFVGSITPAWASISQQTDEIHLDEADYATFKAVLYYFSKRTIGTCDTIYQLTTKGIQQYFTRAVISLLLCDADHYSQLIKKHSKEEKQAQQKSCSVVKGEECDNCNNSFEELKSCSKCRKAKYCTKQCQREHWRVHKLVCVKMPSDYSDTKKEATLRPFPLSRYWYGGDFRFYYAFGNTAAEDFLQGCSVVNQPMILSLGCGDIRSCIYTIWKHFDDNTPKRLDKVHFVLNDCSSPVQARNIIFLYLCLRLPRDIKDRKKWICSIWAIWYCHELYPEHRKIMNDSLAVLLNYSTSLSQWKVTANPLGKIVQFTSSSVLAEVSKIWKTWLEPETAISVQEMNFSRDEELRRHRVFDVLERYAFSYSTTVSHISGDSNINTVDKTREAEVVAYTKFGNCYAENVLELQLSTLPATSVNRSLYEGPDAVYSLHYGSMPFSGYYHTVEFSPDALKSAGVLKTSCDTMLVQTKSFQSQPFLANSVQQFSMWIQSASKVLAQDNKATFTFDNSHALSFCQELSRSSNLNQFDVIYSSNLLDHLSPPNLIVTAIRLLKPSGMLFTTTLLYKTFTSTLEEYITMCFGFDCKLLPVVLGIRCINQEGTGFASLVMTEPSPVDLGNLLKVGRHSRTLIWEKVSVCPFRLQRLPPLVSGNITDALFDSFAVSTLSLLTKSPGQSTLNNNCVETAVHMLQTFSSLLHAGSASSYQFWESLSSSLSLRMKPFLSGLQTQMLLHDLHLHLTVGEDNCPLCNNTPVQDYVGLFCADVPLPLDYATPFFMALVHRYTSSDSRYLCNEALSGKDVHIFDSIDGEVEGSSLKLKFFVPLHFVEENYSITLALSCRREERNIIITCLPTTSLKNMQLDFICYDFSQTAPLSSPYNGLSDLGEMISHMANGEQIWTEIKLSDSTLEALTHHKLKVDRLSANEIKLSCGTISFNLSLNYPVNYNKITIKLSRSQGTLKLVCPRQAYNFAEERPMFITTPDHELSLPPQHVKEGIMLSHSGNQKNKEERHISDSCNRDHALMTPLMNVKESFMILFQHTGERYFRLTNPQLVNRGFVVINRRLFDYEHRAPVIDLAFCFLNSSNVTALAAGWHAITGYTMMENIIVDDAEFEVLRDTLIYFAKRTNGSCKAVLKPNKYQVLCQHRIDRYFMRAVIYFLYCDPDHQGLHIVGQMKDQMTKFPVGVFQTDEKPTGDPAIDEECVYCGNYFPSANKCTGCRKVQYCSKDCQTKHWPAHCSSCHGISEDKDNLATTTTCNIQSTMKSECSFCNEVSQSLKKCKQCGKAQYCNKQCQTKHWPEHKSNCKKFAKAEAPPESSAAIHPAKSLAATCSFCKRNTHALKKCQQCGAAQYCNRECQTLHWPCHKLTCQTKLKSPPSETSGPLCTYCGVSSVELRACSKCGKVQCCKKECQAKHWKSHQFSNY
jgi:2-polyprenyl-3-methyl-5-hydroxy-6-metoxy-1,4-benzoquinol methylase